MLLNHKRNFVKFIIKRETKYIQTFIDISVFSFHYFYMKLNSKCQSIDLELGYQKKNMLILETNLKFSALSLNPHM